ncbi:LPS:glycosyltransferase [Pleurocapsa sp. PCC 7327]|uniref:glycosyltransferase family 8 protein n=1 Tax=Pleurocapsa sp. PCC 7327 TaxID=118163 RepID=UPI00029FA154|nr:glycosyltransferase family 8 protein [Pleurocapsa sp. PCC 7327]AFY76780.1 LPS:glycosyltransferase [Pleurocapsa sp. PCC 7327]
MKTANLTTNQGTANTPDPNTIVVVCAADNGYAMQVAVTMHSILDNLSADRKLLLFIIDGGIEDYNKRKIVKGLHPNRCEVRWLPQPDALLGDIQVLRDFSIGNITEPKHLTIAAYYRLVIPELIPDEIKKAIYLDCDLILNTNIGHLWDLDIGENYLLAAQDLTVLTVSAPTGLLNYKELGLSPDAKYFNSGVLAIDVAKWRADNISAKALKYLREKREYVRWHDQDVLNAVLADRWGELHPAWNQIPTIYRFQSWQDSPYTEDVYNELVYNPYIIHFGGSAKPWNSREEHPFRHLFFKYVDMTAWSGWRFSIWRRLWRRLNREAKQLFNFLLPTKKDSVKNSAQVAAN